MMNKKSTIRSINKQPKISEYAFTKEDNLPENLYNFFVDLGIDEENFYLQHFMVTESWNRDKSGNRFMPIDHFQDYRWPIRDDTFDIDIFFGREKVILVIRTKEDMQQEISEKLFKVARLVGE